MSVNESSLRVYFMGRFNNKVVYQKVFYKYWKRLLVKKGTVHYASTNNQINTYKRLFLKKKFEVLVIPVAIESLLYHTPSQAKGKFLYPMKG